MDNTSAKNIVANSDLWDNKFALPNSSSLQQDILKIPYKTPFTLICFDIVSLHTINDCYGRRVGDMLLFTIRDWILSLNFGQLYRLESDEFGLLVTEMDSSTVKDKASYIYNRFEKAWDLSNNGEYKQIFCTISMGIIESKTLYSANDILNIIERILKNASEQKDIAVYDKEVDRLLKRSREIELSIKECVKNNMQGFKVYYQPIINAITGLWCGVEALCRWTCPSLGEVSPTEFIPIAEKQGIIDDIGSWVLEESISQCTIWELDNKEDFFIDVNISPIQLLDKNLDVNILEILVRHNYPNHKLCLEITESTQLNFNSNAFDSIERLTQKNIPVALDDFGTGYSSFHSLAILPVSVLKTEKSFLDNIENDEYLQRLLETIVGLAHISGMKIIVEGVENTSQMKILMDNKVDYVQGYLFSKALPSGDFEKKLKNFYRKEKNSTAGEYRRIDINSLLDSDNIYSLPPSFHKTLLQCMQILFNASDINDGINAVLAVIGKKLKVNRLVLFLRDRGKNTFTNTHEWCDGKTKPNINQFKNIDITKGTPNFIKLFEKEGMIVSPDISILPKDIFEMFLRIGVKSNIAIPLWQGKELLGYVGLDMCTEIRNWLPEEVLMVHSVCGVLANVLDRISLEKEIIYREKMLRSILNNLDIIIYISDLETDEILFTNDTLNKILGSTTSLVGKTCWEAIYNGKTSRCSFCKQPQLVKNPETAPIIWEHVHEPTGKRYLVYDCIIQWEHSKKAHLEYAFDISNVK